MSRRCFTVLNNAVRLSEKKGQGLEKILQRYGAHAAVTAEPSTDSKAKWSAEYFSLNTASAFTRLSESSKTSLLKNQELRILSEIQLIEVAGMAFTSKMAGLAATVEERELYSFFGADEARHFHLIGEIAPPLSPAMLTNNSFLRFIGELIDSQEPAPLVFFIQVFLEGWGIHYYGGLSRSCQDLRTKQTLDAILKDEASHHGSGLLLFEESRLLETEKKLVHETMNFFLDAIRIGPQAITEALAKTSGGMSVQEVEQFLTELDFQKKVASDLGYIRAILQKSAAPELLASFEAKNAFRIPTARECAEKIISSL